MARTPVRWYLPERASLEQLRRQAKDLRRAVDRGDPVAVALVGQLDPGPVEPAPGTVPLARAQRALARAYGFAGWPQLRRHLELTSGWSREMEPVDDRDGPVEEFLRAACLTFTAPYDPGRALGLLEADPALAGASAATLAATGRADELAALIAGQPAAVGAPDGPHGWPPLLYLCYARLGTGDPSATLRVLLGAGADPDSGFLWRGLPSAFTAVTGVLGGGENGEPPHPRSVELATMLLDAGADPNDNQAFYNRQFEPDDSHLEPLLGHGAGRPRPSPWRERLGRTYPSPEQMVGEHLRMAAHRGFTARVEILLRHGVDPDTRGYHPVFGDRTPYELAMDAGHREIAEVLRVAGARVVRGVRRDRPDGAR